MKVLAISGSLRKDAFSTRLAAAAAGLAPDGADVTVYDGLDGIPGFNQDLEPDGVPSEVEDLRHRIESADAILVVTPEYNASAPGALKNAIDWASRPHGASALMGKPAAVVSSSPMPFGGIWANQQVRKAFSITGTPVAETELAIGKVGQKFDEAGDLNDDETRAQMVSLLAELETLVGKVRTQSLEAAA
jgi:chromate reductase, NAD(P)H dehydrogenase (quinone)